MKDVSQLLKQPQVYLINLPNPSDEVFFQIYIPFGTIHEGKKMRGYAHILEHYILGVMNLHARYMDPDIHINGSVSLFYTKFYLTTKSKTAAKDIALFLKYIYEPDFTHHDVLQYESRSIINELQESRYSLNNEMGDRIDLSIFKKDDSYFISDTLALHNTPRITLRTLERVYTNHLCSADPIFFIGGSNVSSEIASAVCSLIKSYKTKTHPVIDPPHVFKTGVRQSFSLPHIIVGNYVFVGFPAYADTAPLNRRIALGLVCDVLGGRTEFGLFRAMRKQGIYSFSSRRRYFPGQGVITFRSFVDDDQLSHAFRLFHDGVERLKNECVSQSIVDEYIRRRTEHLTTTWRNNDDKFDWLIDDVLSEHTWYAPRAYEKILKTITPQLLREVVCETFDWNKMSLFVFGNKKISLRSLSNK